jgi:hypothetical protein
VTSRKIAASRCSPVGIGKTNTSNQVEPLVVVDEALGLPRAGDAFLGFDDLVAISVRLC